MIQIIKLHCSQIRVVIFLLLVASYSCQESAEEYVDIDSSTLATSSLNQIQINEVELLSTIEDYVDEYKLDSKSSYLRLTIKNARRKTFLITHSDSQISEYSRLPTNYTVHNNFLIAIYSGLDLVYADSSRHLHYLDLMNEMSIELDTSGYLKHPPVWNLSRCDTSNYALMKQSVYGTEFYDLPCGYVLKRGILKFDSIWVERKFEIHH